MNKEICVNCKNYFMWEDIIVVPDGKGLFVKKTITNEVCCKVNRDISKINKCNAFEKYEIAVTEKPIEGKNEEVKPEPKIEEPKKEIRKIAEGRRKKR